MVRETINVYKTSMNLGSISDVEQRITLKQILEKQDVKVETELDSLMLVSRDWFYEFINERRVVPSGMCSYVMWCFDILEGHSVSILTVEN